MVADQGECLERARRFADSTRSSRVRDDVDGPREPKRALRGSPFSDIGSSPSRELAPRSPPTSSGATCGPQRSRRCSRPAPVRRMAVPPGAVASGFGAATGFPATAARRRAWPRSPIHWTSTRRAGSVTCRRATRGSPDWHGHSLRKPSCWCWTCRTRIWRTPSSPSTRGAPDPVEHSEAASRRTMAAQGLPRCTGRVGLRAELGR